MQVWLAILRGVNVSGANIIPMAELRALMAEIGFTGAKTYIQSGNIVFASDLDAETISDKILNAIEDRFSCNPPLMLLTLEDLEKALEENPFPEGADDPKSLHLCFLKEEPSAPRLDEMQKWQKENERFDLQGKTFYLHAPDGIGRSKLAERIERLLGVETTGRNLRSVAKMLDLAKSFAP